MPVHVCAMSMSVNIGTSAVSFVMVQIRVYHTDSSGLLLVSGDAHSAPVNMLHTRPEQNQKMLMLSSSREVRPS